MTDDEEPGKKDWTEFECPECTANNPCHDGFEVGDELFCSYCGAVILVKRFPDDPARYKLVIE